MILILKVITIIPNRINKILTKKTNQMCLNNSKLCRIGFNLEFWNIFESSIGKKSIIYRLIF